MKLTLQKINKSLSPSFRALKPKRDEVDKFKASLSQYFKVTDSSESEENLKTHLTGFLKKHFSPDHLIEPQGNIDCVIRTGKKALAGPDYWQFEGKTLTARRLRLEEEANENQ